MTSTTAALQAQEQTTLDDAFRAWLAAPHEKKPSATNADRSSEDQKNHERSLRYLAAAHAGGEADLSSCSAEALHANDTLLKRQVARGAKLIAARNNRNAPGRKALQNAVSCCKAIQRQVVGEQEWLSAREKLIKRRKQSRRPPDFPYNAWPASLAQEWNRFAAWKLSEFVPPEEEPYHVVCRPSTMNGKRNHINPYVGFLVRERGLTEANLLNLCDPANFTTYLEWYLGADSEWDAAYPQANSRAITLALLSKYLVAKGRLDEDAGSQQKIWDVFYALGRKALEVGAKRGELNDPHDVGEWKPTDLRDIGLTAWSTPPESKQNWVGRRRDHQVFNRRRTGLFFYLAYETPLRLRNWLEMRWGKNLFQDEAGRWVVEFRGEELKVSKRGVRTNVYRMEYSDEACAMINRWRELLQQTFGPDFETTRPHVFAAWSDRREGRVADNMMRQHIRQLTIELRDEDFHPHMVRHIIASYLVNEFGKDGIGLAATLLGDTPEMILRAYYRPNPTEALARYLQEGVSGSQE